MKILLISFFLISAAFSQTYCAGDQISIDHQNAGMVVGAGYDGYEAGDEFRLADWNGQLNGGSYHIIFVDMSASW